MFFRTCKACLESLLRGILAEVSFRSQSTFFFLWLTNRAPVAHVSIGRGLLLRHRPRPGQGVAPRCCCRDRRESSTRICCRLVGGYDDKDRITPSDGWRRPGSAGRETYPYRGYTHAHAVRWVMRCTGPPWFRLCFVGLSAVSRESFVVHAPPPPSRFLSSVG